MATTQDQIDSTPNPWLGFIYFGAWYLLFVDGLWGYVQHIILKKKYLPSSLFVATLVMLLLLHRPNKSVSRPEFRIMYVFICWMFLTVLTASQINFSSPFRIMFGLYVNYWHFFLVVIAMGSAFRMSDRQFSQLFFLGAAPVVLLGVAQGIMQDNFGIGTWISQEASAFNLGFYGKRRANAVFAHADDFGFFCGLVIALATAFFLKTNWGFKKVFWMGVIGTSLIGLYFTYTRAAYLMSALSMLAVFSLYKTQNTKYASYAEKLPFLFFAIAVAIYFSAPLIHLFSSSSTVLSSASLGERIYGNQYYFTEITKAGWYALFTGLGWFINGHYKAGVAIDNQFVAVLVSTGLVGLLLWLSLTFFIWMRLVRKATSSNSAVVLGLAGAASTWLAQSMFNVTATMAFIGLLAFVMHDTSSDASTKTIQH